MVKFRLATFAMLVIGAFGLAACVGGEKFRTYYAAPVSAEVSRNWRLADVVVNVPQSLTVSEEKVYLPHSDLVWREDPPGDRHQQIAALLRNAVMLGAKGLPGAHPVRIEVVVSRFHALTFEAERLNLNAGVHNIFFTVRVVDAASGKVLAGPDAIEASLPAKSGTEMIAARARGESQRSQITAHVSAVIAGWLGIGPDARTTFDRIGI